ncbi:MAG: precorrin-6y C5,15-methyltransferase (decarboxylating) subunit CbiE [Chloroflexi bacterium]|nr:precorrin-6y C5,15-methyltransferase (decarboxylating) subunit CbiE [Chloroflexota bacterium]
MAARPRRGIVGGHGGCGAAGCVSGDALVATIVMVGIGPGDPELLTLKGRTAIEDADYVAAFGTVLEPVSRWIRGAAMPMTYADQDQVLDQLAAHARSGKQCVVCAWGDLNFSAGELVARVRQRAEVELIPGVSSVQVACARLGLAMERSLFITLHVRDGHEAGLNDLIESLRSGERHLIVLPRPYDLMPRRIAEVLLDAGVSPDTSVHVLERLSLPGERIAERSLASLASDATEWSDLTILVFPVGP